MQKEPYGADAVNISPRPHSLATNRESKGESWPLHALRELPSSAGLLPVHGIALVLALVVADECHSVVTHFDPQASKAPSIIYGLAVWYWWALLSVGAWQAIKNSARRTLSLKGALATTFTGVLVAILHLYLLQVTVEWLIVEWPILRSAGYGDLHYFTERRFGFELLLCGFIVGICVIVQLQLASQRTILRTLSLEKELSTAHLRALQMQIEPHFLFNTLNTITSLVEVDHKEDAAQMLQHLTALLQSTFRKGVPKKVPLSQELELVDDYLSIEEIRFADRLRVDMTINPRALDGQVPCFLLQPMIENALQHGISRCKDGGTISITADRRDRRLHICVADNGPGPDGESTPGNGIGLTNTRERLRHFYGEDFAFRAGIRDLGGFEVRIDIPFEGITS